MKIMRRIFLLLGCLFLLLVSWVLAITGKTDAQRQRELIDQANAYMEDDIYILAVPLLEEAAGYRAAYLSEAEDALKTACLHLLNTRGYALKYTDILDRQMARPDAEAAVFREAADYYLESSYRLKTALDILREGSERTGDAELTDYYEKLRYDYHIGYEIYEEASEIANGASMVRKDGLWGLASQSGKLTIPCEYDKVSTCSNDRLIVQQGDVISGIDLENHRIALCHKPASDFSNFSENRLWLKIQDGWTLANEEFLLNALSVEEAGMFSDGAAPVKQHGKCGLVDTDGDSLLSAEYDGIIRDELGRAYSQDAVFVRKDGNVILLANGKALNGTYEDARPFADGWAAVKKDGLWGFIDAAGTVRIDFQYEDARSFGGHLAAVKSGAAWGYVSLRGELVIAPVFLEAKSFHDGSAPVRTEEGWQFITLTEYEKDVGF